jgi:ADP-heptose:LPS heptosyltransferase
LPRLVLSHSELEHARSKIELWTRYRNRPVVGVFVGGRNAWDKRWPLANFCSLISALGGHRLNVLAFVGPEEKDLIPSLRSALGEQLCLVNEESPRTFAAVVSKCNLFITGDSGPMHLACSVGTRVVAIFLKPDFARWAPPSTIARVLYRPGGCSPENVLAACELELGADEL